MKAQIVYYMHISPTEFDKMSDRAKFELWQDLIWVREEEARQSKKQEKNNK